MLRASITAMREIARRIHDDESLQDVEGRVAGVKEVFRLVGNDELEAAEARYLPAPQRQRAIVLAASRGELGELTRDKPKCMIDVRGQPLLQRLVSTLLESGVRDTLVVRGYRKEAVSAWGARMVDNDQFAETGEVYSLGMAGEALTGELVIAYGDVLFRRYILDSLLVSSADIVLAVDARPWTPASASETRDLVVADHRFSGDYLDDAPSHLISMAAAQGPSAKTAGEWMGLARLSAQGATWLVEEIEALKAEGLYESADLPTLFTRLAARHPVRIKYFTGHWMDVDTLADLADARNFT
jgi:phosphoenolpyruvate phosphomutase